MKKQVIKYNKNGESGNIFYILAMVRKALMKERRINEFNDLWEKVQGCKSYNDALKEINKVVELIEEI